MKFKLIINGSGAHKLDETVIIDALDNSLKQHEDYIVLEPKSSIDNNIYLQVMYNGDENIYCLETRFMYEDDSFKHYEYQTTDLSEVKNIFTEYYHKHTLSSLSRWISDSDSEDDYMCKLYKTFDDDTICYAEFWINEDENITMHRGVLGEVGETEENILANNEVPVLYLEKFEEEYKKQGYVVLEDLYEIIVQYVLNQEDDEDELLEVVEDEINQALGWTGNGHCEGGDIEAGVISVFCQVVDRQIALDTIIDIFEENGLLQNITVSTTNDETEEYEIIYPID